jgi:hypothetical protein
MAQKTLCYKKNVNGSSVDESIQLNGKDCQGDLTIKDMRKLGWSLDDIKITNTGDGYNHLYIFARQTVQEPLVQNIMEPKVVKYDLSKKELVLNNVNNNSATINIGDLTIGQSGIVINTQDSNSIIVSQAIVTSSNSISSTVQFNSKEILVQNAIPTTKLKPQNGDKFILNHLYGTSLLIVPNVEAKNSVIKLYEKQNFLNEDFFASYLKLTETPSPTREDISDFCQSQQIGTIFMVIKNTLYVVDTLSFKIIDTIELNIEDSSTTVPFLTKVTKIEKGFWSFSSGQITDYNRYYSNLLGI